MTTVVGRQIVAEPESFDPELLYARYLKWF